MPNAPQDNPDANYGAEDEWLAWYRLSRIERLRESEKPWDFYPLAVTVQHRNNGARKPQNAACYRVPL